MDHVPRMNWAVPNLAETFKLFKQRIELYFLAKRIEIADQVVHILLQVGNEGLQRYNSWTMSEEDKTDPKKIFAAFEEQLEPPENYRISRLKLTQYRQTREESLDDFTNRCKLQALKCDFVDDELNERLIELIISSTPIVDFQKELLNKLASCRRHTSWWSTRTYLLGSTRHAERRSLLRTKSNQNWTKWSIRGSFAQSKNQQIGSVH